MAHEKNTFFKVYRSLLEDEKFWLSEKFSKGQAWIDLIGLANYGDVKKLEGHEIKIYKRGQVVTSIKTLAERWQWSRHMVSDFLSLLEQEHMISQKRTSRGTVLTIENYGLYQDKPKASGHLKDITRTSQGHHRDISRTQNKKNKEDYKNTQEERDTRTARGPYGRVTLSEGEMEKFLGDYPEDGQRFINELDAVMERDNKSYRNCLPALYKWADNEKAYKAKHAEPEVPRTEGGTIFSWTRKEDLNELSAGK